MVTGTRVQYFSIEEDGENEITLKSDVLEEFSLNYGDIPEVSKNSDLRTLLHRHKQETGQLPNYIPLHKNTAGRTTINAKYIN